MSLYDETLLMCVCVHLECGGCVLCFDMLQSYQKLSVLCNSDC